MTRKYREKIEKKTLKVRSTLLATCVNKFEEQQCEQAGEIFKKLGTLGSNPASVKSCCIVWGKSYILSVLQLPYLYNEGNNLFWAYFRLFVKGPNKIVKDTKKMQHIGPKFSLFCFILLWKLLNLEYSSKG